MAPVRHRHTTYRTKLRRRPKSVYVPRKSTLYNLVAGVTESEVTADTCGGGGPEMEGTVEKTQHPSTDEPCSKRH